MKCVAVVVDDRTGETRRCKRDAIRCRSDRLVLWCTAHMESGQPFVDAVPSPEPRP